MLLLTVGACLSRQEGPGVPSLRGRLSKTQKLSELDFRFCDVISFEMYENQLILLLKSI